MIKAREEFTLASYPGRLQLKLFLSKYMVVKGRFIVESDQFVKL